jgi:hypothetical protein
MRETTAEMWIGPDESSSWAGGQNGINATFLLLLRENSRPSWLLLPGNFYDRNPPFIGPSKAWIPTQSSPAQDALLLFAVLGAKVPEIRAVFNSHEKARGRNNLDLSERFPGGLPKDIYTKCQEHLFGWKIVLSVGKHSLANEDINELGSYKGLNIDVRTSR